jgi:glycosyltransferase involved in cell wall biosynthesis
MTTLEADVRDTNGDANQASAFATRAGQAELPVYVEVSALMGRHVTGIGRWVALLIEALLRIGPVRLIRTVHGDFARSMRMSNALRCGREIALPQGCMPAADDDLLAWTRRLFRRPCRPLNESLMQRCGVVYPFLRPAERRFRREFCVLRDYTPLLFPMFHVPETLDQFGKLFTHRAPLCDKLITDSESTRADSRWLTPFPPERVMVGAPGPSMCVRRHAWPQPVEQQEHLILIVSTLEPRKNGAFLLKWFLKTAMLPDDAELWWVGQEGWLFRASARTVGGSPRSRRIRFLGRVSDRRLCELYRQASVTIYPSLYEGFGFPVIDSLRHGTPVLCGYNSSLTEFAGPGVFYFDATDPASLDQAYHEFLASDSSPVVRTDLDERWNWDRMARTIASLCTEE